LLLIAASLKEGLKINLRGKVTSLPYIKMTLSLLTQIGVHSSFEDNSIRVHPVERDTLQPITIDVESDWSSASYFYSCLALSEVDTSLHLSILKENSLQGDACLADIYSSFGIETSFKGNGVVLKKVAKPVFDSRIDLHLEHAPDIAQTIAVTAFGLGIDCYLSGLHTLKIKETDRLVALKTELEKLGAEVAITDSTLTLVGTKTIRENIAISTYNDHRMAMAFAPLGLKVPINFENADVVSKSYPNFWQDLKSLGFEIK
jgi:3-phosphoshikimate 1-carboxyvinyltransferase